MGSRTSLIGSMLLMLGLGLANCVVGQTTTPGDAAVRVPIIQLGPSDSVSITVYGQPDMSATVYVSDDGTIPVALAGPVKVAGLSPDGAAKQIEKALRDGKFFNDPHVTLTVVQSRSQRVSVLGEVGNVGRYPIESNTSLFDLLALAGGVKQTAATTVYLLRTDADGKVLRYPVDVTNLNDPLAAVPAKSLKGGDSILVPRADQYYLYGEIAQPNMFRLEPGTTVLQAIVRAGGLTPKGSYSRIELKRQGADGKSVTRKAKMDELVQPNDIIRVKESIF